ncbi:hypothetical protein K504DRAFT_445567 [Pleomassaria siparia CBS 279.74]|uniref:C3H1-type domain-containing protein n=1 Tax=Pleomassaria siparia CBS 279.74 TaxID=1314801 RepID=A0A6G1KQC6_9PLEO|nr:hypothetical protein K504DRAFT_445567 [Pleomassaria siparia CBS 279.74]
MTETLSKKRQLPSLTSSPSPSPSDSRDSVPTMSQQGSKKRSPPTDFPTESPKPAKTRKLTSSSIMESTELSQLPSSPSSPSPSDSSDSAPTTSQQGSKKRSRPTDFSTESPKPAKTRKLLLSSIRENTELRLETPTTADATTNMSRIVQPDVNPMQAVLPSTDTTLTSMEPPPTIQPLYASKDIHENDINYPGSDSSAEGEVASGARGMVNTDTDTELSVEPQQITVATPQKDNMTMEPIEGTNDETTSNVHPEEPRVETIEAQVEMSPQESSKDGVLAIEVHEVQDSATSHSDPNTQLVDLDHDNVDNRKPRNVEDHTGEDDSEACIDVTSGVFPVQMAESVETQHQIADSGFVSPHNDIDGDTFVRSSDPGTDYRARRLKLVEVPLLQGIKAVIKHVIPEEYLNLFCKSDELGGSLTFEGFSFKVKLEVLSAPRYPHEETNVMTASQLSHDLKSINGDWDASTARDPDLSVLGSSLQSHETTSTSGKQEENTNGVSSKVLDIPEPTAQILDGIVEKDLPEKSPSIHGTPSSTILPKVEAAEPLLSNSNNIATNVVIKTEETVEQKITIGNETTNKKPTEGPKPPNAVDCIFEVSDPRGCLKKHSGCPYNHDVVKKPIPNGEKGSTQRNLGRKPCTWVNRPQGCKKGDECAYDHGLEGMLCKNVKNMGICSRGTKCAYMHPDEHIELEAQRVEQEQTVLSQKSGFHRHNSPQTPIATPELSRSGSQPPLYKPAYVGGFDSPTMQASRMNDMNHLQASQANSRQLDNQQTTGSKRLLDDTNEPQQSDHGPKRQKYTPQNTSFGNMQPNLQHQSPGDEMNGYPNTMTEYPNYGPNYNFCPPGGYPNGIHTTGGFMPGGHVNHMAYGNAHNFGDGWGHPNNRDRGRDYRNNEQYNRGNGGRRNGRGQQGYLRENRHRGAQQ